MTKEIGTVLIIFFFFLVCTLWKDQNPCYQVVFIRLKESIKLVKNFFLVDTLFLKNLIVLTGFGKVQRLELEYLRSILRSMSFD